MLCGHVLEFDFLRNRFVFFVWQEWQMGRARLTYSTYPVQYTQDTARAPTS